MKYILAVFLILISASFACARYVTISWDAVAGATSYALYWGAESGMETWTYELDVGNVTEYNLPINEETTYLVVTANDGTEGPESDEITILTTIEPATITKSSGISIYGGTIQ